MKSTNNSPGSPMRELNILLADDDKDDCLLFQEALEDLELQTVLTLVYNGDQLMQLLARSGSNFDVLFLDLNMPRKNGFTCLEEIKRDDRLKSLPVIILSTTFSQSVTDRLYKGGAQFYICKPPDFSELRKIIHEVLLLVV